MKLYEELSFNEKRVAKSGTLLFLVLLDLFVAALFVSYAAGAWKDLKALREPKLQISVSGEGKVSAKPDVVKFAATVLSEGKALLDVQGDNTKRYNAAIDFLKKNGFADKDIKTTGYNIYPQYSYPHPCTIFPCLEDEKPQIIGYQIQNTFEVTVHDTAKIGDILSGIVDAGANEVSNLQFALDKPDELRAEARKAAIDDARAKAERLAKDLGKGLGKIISFSESGAVPPPIFFAETMGKGGGFGMAPAPSIQPGENEITVDVNVMYEFR